MDVKWRTLSSIGTILLDVTSVGVDVAGKMTKGVSAVMNLATDGIVAANDLTKSTLDTVTNGVKSGSDYVSNGLSELGSQAEKYAKRLSSKPEGGS